MAFIHRVDRGQLQQIIAGLAEGVLLIDPYGSNVRANEAALAMHGCERADDLGATATGYRKRFVLRNHVSAVYARIGVNPRSAGVVWRRERGLAAY